MSLSENMLYGVWVWTALVSAIICYVVWGCGLD